MPIYEFVCDECGHHEDIICSMDEIVGKVVNCPDCWVTDGAYTPVGEEEAVISKRPVPMRRVFSTGGLIFKGTGWPSKAIKRQGEDQDIKRQRKKASVLKDRGDIPWEHTIHPKDADPEYDKRYAEKDLDNLYQGTVEEGK